MTFITSSHFGANIILTRDSVTDTSPFRQVLKELSFSHFRYPGGGVTEEQSWENGGLVRMFGDPMDPDDANYVMTIREALQFAQDADTSLTIVVPSMQFLNRDTGGFRQEPFDRYIAELERALLEFPDVKIRDFEIGNEFWGSKSYGAMTPREYGFVANAEIRPLYEMTERIAADNPLWEMPGIGIQAGAAWRTTGPLESRQIASIIEYDNRGLIDTIFQHSYPDLDRNQTGWQQDWAIDPMKEFRGIDGFRSGLKLSVSEFNVVGRGVTGVDQAAGWIEELSAHIDKGVDEFQHWGISYEWLSNKFYDTKFPQGESNNGEIIVKATPLGQIYDLASSTLAGKSTMTDDQAIARLGLPDKFGVTGFRDAGQRVIFLHNGAESDGKVDLSDIPPGWHVSVHHLKNADSPYTSWYDESLPVPPGAGEIADARGDMHVVSGQTAPDNFTLSQSEMAVLVMSRPGRDLTIEGAHNVTDDRTGMVDDHIFGGSGNDILRGHVGNDTLHGAAGRNVLSGGKGDDILKAGNKGDVIFADGGKDDVKGGNGDDVIFATGRNEGDRADIETGDGRDMVYAMSNQEVIIRDFSDEDVLGLGGSFVDADALQAASRVDGEDLLVDLPNGGLVRLSGSADRIDTLRDNVIEFIGSEEPRAISSLAEAVDPAAFFEGLSYEQVLEIYDGVSSANDHDGDRFEMSWDDIEQTIAKLGLAPASHDPYDPGVGDPWKTAEDVVKPDPGDTTPGGRDPGRPHPEDPPLPSRDPEPDDGVPDDEEDEQNPESGTGGACFVATAAYGDRLHPDVVALRRFRDHHLVRFRAGRAFVRFYWVVGPVLAKFTRPNQVHARMTRLVLSYLVRSFLRSRNLCDPSRR